MKYRFMNEHRHDYAATLMCRVLPVARAGFYAWLHEPVSDHAKEDARLQPAGATWKIGRQLGFRGVQDMLRAPFLEIPVVKQDARTKLGIMFAQPKRLAKGR